VLYVGSTRSESRIPGGHVIAVDAKSGEVRWHFNTVPQSESDQGWNIAGPTWVGGGREGGGIWETPSIDPELGLMYVAVGNPFGDSTLRSGLNLFSDSVVALSLENGQMEWYYQLVHHDVWDYDNGQQPILFDMKVDGAPIKALAQANKNGWLYILNRETGEPVHSIIETPVPTETDREGEQPWPTQPIPHKANGERMEPVSPVFPLEIPADHLAENRLVEQFTPLGQDIIFAPTKSDNPKAELTEVCHRILDYFRALIPTAIHLMTHPGISMDDVTQHFKPAASGSLNNALAEYLRGADRLGEMSVPDPVASAGLLISALHSLPLFEMMKFHGGADLSHAVEKFVDAQWQGFRPEMIHQPGSRKGKSK